MSYLNEIVQNWQWIICLYVRGNFVTICLWGKWISVRFGGGCIMSGRSCTVGWRGGALLLLSVVVADCVAYLLTLCFCCFSPYYWHSHNHHYTVYYSPAPHNAQSTKSNYIHYQHAPAIRISKQKIFPLQWILSL